MNKKNLILNEEILPNSVINICINHVERKKFIINQEKSNLSSKKLFKEIKKWEIENENEEIMKIEDFFLENKFNFYSCENSIDKNIFEEVKNYLDKKEIFFNFDNSKEILENIKLDEIKKIEILEIEVF